MTPDNSCVRNDFSPDQLGKTPPGGRTWTIGGGLQFPKTVGQTPNSAPQPQSSADDSAFRSKVRPQNLKARLQDKVKPTRSTRLSWKKFRKFRSSRLFSYPFSHPSRPFSRRSKHYILPAIVGTRPVDALADTGAQCNCISQQLAHKAGLVPENDTAKSIQLPNGNQVLSPGAVKVTVSILGQDERYELGCWIIPGCKNDLVLSGSFLSITGTLPTLKTQIRRQARTATNRRRVNFLDNARHRLRGSLNSLPVLALPDTGSDVMLVSSQYARDNNLDIDPGLEHRCGLEFADGSTALTAGIVRDVTWTFGDSGHSIRCDFYVLDGLSVDVVLSAEFIFKLKVFSSYRRFMVYFDSTSHFLELYNIRLISKYGRKLKRLESLSINDMNSPEAFSHRSIKAERVRCDRIRDAIIKLPPEQRPEAWRAEEARQRNWRELRHLHSQNREALVASSSNPIRPKTPPGLGVPCKKPRWWVLHLLCCRVVRHKEGL
ncbi:hypothetical protein FDECE_7702 [Fusarium decemcellulare]|nr:hypothetical protein FDECE_7702 [Fusarium decemcellulare]